MTGSIDLIVGRGDKQVTGGRAGGSHIRFVNHTVTRLELEGRGVWDSHQQSAIG